MKKLFTIGICLLFVLPVIGQKDITEEVNTLLKTGNSTELASFFTSTIDLAVGETDNAVSRAQAEAIVKDFFRKNKPDDFVLSHQGESKRGIQYRIGDLKTVKGESYSVTYYMKVISDKYYIQQLRIE